MVGTNSNSRHSTKLAERLSERIQREGPITFNEWMRAALYDPKDGYYNRLDLRRWGREGDYRTSPEISELFAATFARYFSQLYDELGRPVCWTILECGAGDGSFAKGILGTLQTAFPEIFAVTRYCIDEVSAEAASQISKVIGDLQANVEFTSLETVPPINPGIVFSNELLDAFPVHRLTKEKGKLVELYVALGGASEFTWTTGPLSLPGLSDFLVRNDIDVREGQIIEVSLALEQWLVKVTAKLRHGYLISVDYGEEASSLYEYPNRQNGTLRAYSRHQFVDVLEQPGEHDITSTVNWTQVRTAGEALGLKTIRFERLDKFLIDSGILQELEQRLNSAGSDARRLELTTRAREMILPGNMASSFQVLIQKANS